MSIIPLDCKLPFTLDDISSFVQKMTLQQKIGQLFISIVYGHILTETAKKYLEKSHLGNVILYPWANGCESPEQVFNLSQKIHETIQTTSGGIFPIIAADVEGGRVNALKKYLSLPSAKQMAETNDPNTAKNIGQAIAKALLASGMNMNLAPVVDINSNPNNPVIGDRSFGNDPKTVITYTDKFLEGLQKDPFYIMSSAKHAPGHGDTDKDSHTSLPVVNKTRKQLKDMELKPFKELAHKSPAIMTAHILFPALDKENCATKSPIILQHLRKEIGFEGIIISDNLSMLGVSPHQNTYEEAIESITEAALASLKAGCNMFIIGKSHYSKQLQTTPEQDMHLTQQVLQNILTYSNG